jgi:hypothetical protein
VVVREVVSRAEQARVDTGSPMQSAVCPACGTRRGQEVMPRKPARCRAYSISPMCRSACW